VHLDALGHVMPRIRATGFTDHKNHSLIKAGAGIVSVSIKPPNKSHTSLMQVIKR
jgi:hypothetical protein